MTHIKTFEGFINEGYEKPIEDASKIKNKLNKLVIGIYVLDGGLKSDGTWNETSLKNAKPLLYTSDLRVNYNFMTNLINDMEEKYPNITTFTIVDIDKNGNMDVKTM